MKERLDALGAIQAQIKQVQEKSEEGQKAMTLDTTISLGETSTFEVKKTEFTPAGATSGTGMDGRRVGRRNDAGAEEGAVRRRSRRNERRS